MGYKGSTSDTYVTGSSNSMTASKGPILVRAPPSVKSNPASERFLINKTMSCPTYEITYVMLAALKVRLAPSTRVCTIGGATTPIK